MVKSPGKIFEEDFFKSFSSHVDISIDRVYDTMSGFKGHNTFCDFMVYRLPYKYYFELKSYDGDYIPLSAIRENQFQGLMNKAYIRGVTAGVIFNFRISEDFEVAYFVDIRKINELKAQDVKSVNIAICSKLGVRMAGRKLRTRYRYEVETLLAEIDNWRKQYG